MSRTVTRYAGTSTANALDVYVCPVGKIAKIKFELDTVKNLNYVTAFSSATAYLRVTIGGGYTTLISATTGDTSSVYAYLKRGLEPNALILSATVAAATTETTIFDNIILSAGDKINVVTTGTQSAYKTVYWNFLVIEEDAS